MIVDQRDFLWKNKKGECTVFIANGTNNVITWGSWDLINRTMTYITFS